MAILEEFKALWAAPHPYGVASVRNELAFAAFPASNVTPRETTAEAYASFLRREEAGRLGSIQRVVGVTHYTTGEKPHLAHGVRFTMANGTQQYFAPHGA